MDSVIISTIIGLWRCGADNYQIEGITGMHPNNIETAIQKHQDILYYKEFLERIREIKNHAQT